MKNILLVTISFAIVFGIAVTGFCQDLRKNLQLTIEADKDLYKIKRSSPTRSGGRDDYPEVHVGIKIELKNIGNSELEIEDLKGLYYCGHSLKFEIEPTTDVRMFYPYQNIILPPRVILKPGEIIRGAKALTISTKSAGEYKLSARYTMDKINYITSNTIPIKAIEERALEIIIKSNKIVYGQNGDIMIGGIIKNISREKVFLHLAPSYSPEFEICSTDSTYRAVYSGGVKLTIIRGRIDYEKPYFKFVPHEEKTFRPRNIYNFKWYYYNDNLPSPFANNGRLKPGRYTIRLVRFSYIHKGEEVTFEVDSNPVTIEIVKKRE